MTNTPAPRSRRTLASFSLAATVLALAFLAPATAATAADGESEIFYDVPAPASAETTAGGDREDVYDSLPTGVVQSYAFAARSTSEVGDLVQLGGTNRILDDIVIFLSSSACENFLLPVAQCLTTPGATFGHELTMNIREVDRTDPANPAAGVLIASVTQLEQINYRPSADPTCPNPSDYRDAGTGGCFSAVFDFAIFDFSSLNVELPEEIIYTLAFNTQTSGAEPTGEPGPYNSLNFVFSTETLIGTDDSNDEIFIDANTEANYLSPGPAGVLRLDSGWETNNRGPGKFAALIRATEPHDVVVTDPGNSEAQLAATGSDAGTGLVVGSAVALVVGLGLLAVGARRARRS